MSTKKQEAIDRSVWRKSVELTHEFGYSDSSIVRSIIASNKISTINNPENKHKNAQFYNRTEFMRVPQVIQRIVEAIDIEKYDGQIVCSECNALLHIKLVKGKLQKYEIVENPKAGEPVRLRVVYENETNNLNKES